MSVEIGVDTKSYCNDIRKKVMWEAMKTYTLYHCLTASAWIKGLAVCDDW